MRLLKILTFTLIGIEILIKKCGEEIDYTYERGLFISR